MGVIYLCFFLSHNSGMDIDLPILQIRIIQLSIDKTTISNNIY